MESPVFKLEKVVHSRAEELQDFEGPLDLILFLLGKNKMEIQDISISLICAPWRSAAGGRAMPMSRPWRRRWPPWGSSAGTS